MTSPAPVETEKLLDIDSDLKAVEVALGSHLVSAEGRPERLLAAMRYAVMGPGKRLRPRLALLAARACQGDSTCAIPAACAVELIHAYSLVHDDLPAMDDDDLRRGRPTVHRQFDEATAILVGDALQALAFEALAVGISDSDRAARCCLELATTAGASGLVGGQADDLAAGNEIASDDVNQRLAHLHHIHSRKTGRLIVASLRLGAIASGGSETEIKGLTKFGESLGLLFQVTDDLLDTGGNATVVGKQVGKDAGRGKLTYPGLMGIDASLDYAKELSNEAITALDIFAEEAEPLRQLTRQILTRDR